MKHKDGVSLVITTHNMNVGAWLENEIKYHTDYDNIFVFNTGNNIGINSELEKYAKCYNIQYDRISLLFELVKCVFSVYLWTEIKYILTHSPDAFFQKVWRALTYLATSNLYAKEMERILCKNGVQKDDKIMFYAYWLSVQAETCFYLKKIFNNAKFISRCHRIDLYEETQKNSYLEYRQLLFDQLDMIYCISEHGKSYLKEKYKDRGKCAVSFLGSVNRLPVMEKKSGKKDVIRIVSCSSIIPVKRVDRLIEIFSRIKDVNVIWHHYGDGPLREELQEKLSVLPDNISCEFKGMVAHEKILDMYQREQYDLLINVSISEGIPVSMMEALSMGIPILATDVGGVNEIVKNGITGYLLDVNADISEYHKYIYEFYNMNDQEYQLFHSKCRLFWEQNFNAEQNFMSFADDIHELICS